MNGYFRSDPTDLGVDMKDPVSIKRSRISIEAELVVPLDTKEKPFRCQLCPSAFTRKDLLTRHHNIVHDPPKQQVSPPASENSVEHGNKRIESSLSSATSSNSTSIPTTTSNPLEFSLWPQNPDLINGIPQPQGAQISLSMETPLDSVMSGFADQLPPFMDDFGIFMDSISIPTHPFSPSFQPFPILYSGNAIHISDQAYPSSIAGVDVANPSHGETELDRLSKFGSRLPSLGPDETPDAPIDDRPKRGSHASVSSTLRDYIIRTMPRYNCVATNIDLPSTHALSRFISGYFTGFHNHYPIFHIPTFRLESLSVELILSIAALGAQYHRESEQGLILFHASKAIALERIKRRDARGSAVSCSFSPPPVDQSGNSSLILEEDGHLDGGKVETLEILQCLLLLIATGTWFKRRSLAREAMALRSILESIVREDGLMAPDTECLSNWEAWARVETIKRTKLIIFCFYNIHTITFNLPPVLLCKDVHLSLPCTEREWQADTSPAWKELRKERDQEQSFQVGYQTLFSPREIGDVQPRFSSLGGYVLIHALIQDIWLLQRVSQLPLQLPSDPFSEHIAAIESALKRWSTGWEQNQESSMNPMNEYGPLSFTSTALLRLAYIRINLDVESKAGLSSWDAQKIALSLHDSPAIKRNERLTRAALHCAHALSIPIKLGINYVAQNQVIFWSNAHAICSLDCALLLAKWLEAVTVPNPEPALSTQEQKLLGFVIEMVNETEFKASTSNLLQHNRRLSAIVAKLWAKLFRPDSVWELVGKKSRHMSSDNQLTLSRLDWNVPTCVWRITGEWARNPVLNPPQSSKSTNSWSSMYRLLSLDLNLQILGHDRLGEINNTPRLSKGWEMPRIELYDLPILSTILLRLLNHRPLLMR